MLTVLIETRNHEEALARSLGALVPAAVEGFVREVIVCDRGSTDHTQYVAEHAGCHFLANGGIAAGIRQAKGEWLLLLEPGARLADGWTEEVAVHAAHQTSSARFSRVRSDRAPFLMRIFSARRPLAQGLLITKRQALALASAGRDAEGIARGLAAKRLPAEIFVAAR
jgi:glycosyltransferase involved in cell wall biosynthesis